MPGWLSYSLGNYWLHFYCHHRGLARVARPLLCAEKAFRFGEVALRVPPNGLRRKQSTVAVVSMALPIE